MKHKYNVGDTVKPNGRYAEWKEPFVVGNIYYNTSIADEDGPKWCYLPVGEEPDFMFGEENNEVEGKAPYNSWWEGYLDLVKRKVTMEENE